LDGECSTRGAACPGSAATGEWREGSDGCTEGRLELLWQNYRGAPGTTYGIDFIAQLRSLSADPSIPQSARDAADRLQARLTPDFQSQSVNPVSDAETILAFIFSRLQ